jgi:hypothetical protein
MEDSYRRNKKVGFYVLSSQHEITGNSELFHCCCRQFHAEHSVRSLQAEEGFAVCGRNEAPSYVPRGKVT